VEKKGLILLRAGLMNSKEESPILLLDTFRTDLFKKVVLKKYNYKEVAKPSIKDALHIFYNPSLFFLFIKSIFLLKGIRSAIVYTYFYSAISNNKPKVVVGFYIAIKRKYFFYLANKFKNIEFIAVAPCRIDSLEKYTNIVPSRAKFFVHGDSDKNELISRGYDKELVYSYGSFYSHIHSTNIVDKSLKYDICILSQYLHQWEDENLSDERKTQIKIFNLLMDYISRFCLKNPQLKIAIAMRPQEKGEYGSHLEKNYFLEKIGNINPIFINSDERNGSSYQASLNSEVIITHYSTLGFELIGFKKKVLFFQPYQFEFAPIPSRLKWKIMSPSYNDFENQLTSLLNLNIENYEKTIVDDAQYFNNMDHDLIKKVCNMIDKRVGDEKNS
jgi:hypothetical protein